MTATPRIKSYRPDGTARSIWNDAQAKTLRAAGVVPRRASRVEVIEEGPHRGLFHVDFTLLADATGDDRYRVCLVSPFETHAAAVAAEVAWLNRNWVTAPG